MKQNISSFAATILAILCLLASPVQAQDDVNVVDFDLSQIINCVPNDAIPAVICESLLDLLIDDLIEAEEILDQIFAGYREDIPRFIRNQLDEPVLIYLRMVEDDGPFGTLAFVVPEGDPDDPTADVQIDFAPPPFLSLFFNYRAWSITRSSTINLDVDDIVFLLISDQMVPTVVHEAMHSLGHPRNFEVSNLNRELNFFGQTHFLGDEFGINRVGYGLTEFRSESQNPFATYVPLSTTDGGGHLSPFEPAFNRPDQAIQEVFLPTAPPPGVRDFISRAIRGMFADLAFKIRGVNTPGIIDLDGDGVADEPLIVRPDLPTDP